MRQLDAGFGQRVADGMAYRKALRAHGKPQELRVVWRQVTFVPMAGGLSASETAREGPGFCEQSIEHQGRERERGMRSRILHSSGPLNRAQTQTEYRGTSSHHLDPVSRAGAPGPASVLNGRA